MLTVGDIVFVDTNILLIATDGGREGHKEARTLIAKAARAGVHLAFSGQVQREYLVVATRSPDLNGLGMTASDALSNVEAFLSRIALCEESEPVSERLREIVREHGVCGKRVHDANIVATMRAHGVSVLLTENPTDFQTFRDIRLVRLKQAASDVAGLLP